MTKQDFINKYVYGVGNDALTDNQEAASMSKDLDEYVSKQLHQLNASEQREQFYCVSSNALVYGNPCKKWCGDENCKSLCTNTN